MKILVRCFFAIILSTASSEATMFHLKAPINHEWTEENLPPFDELMISWNATRPIEGCFHFYVRLKTDEWSPWLLYASWGSDGQSSFLSTALGSPVRVYQDALEVTEGEKATAFQIKIITDEYSHLDDIYGLHVYINSDKNKELQKPDSSLSSITLEVPGISQMALNHPRHEDLCSPTSTTAVTSYLLNNATLDPSDFAEQVWDSGFDIYGNWVFNIAQASTHLGSAWDCWVERLNGFDCIYQYLKQGTPVIVSVRGPLTGSAQPYPHGHLIAVIGYDSLNQRVLCMDPAFPKDSETHVSYDLSDFVQAWSRRGNVAYIFNKKHEKENSIAMTSTFEIFPSLMSISNQFNGILLDAYGVFWGGNATGLLPGSKEIMEKLVFNEKIVGILSNSTQLASKEIDKLHRHGLIQGQHFHFLVTSGDIARDIFLNEKLPFETPRKTFWLFGGIHPKFSSHEAIFKDTRYRETPDINQADFIYISVPHINGEDQLDSELFRQEIAKIKPKNLPMVCPNPDLFAHEGNPPKAVVRQGSIAKIYEELGGQVFFIGKPHHRAYSDALDQFKNYQLVDPKEIIMVGDTPETDIRGARLFGMSSALILQTGIMADRISHKGFEEAMKELSAEDIPDYFIERL